MAGEAQWIEDSHLGCDRLNPLRQIKNLSRYRQIVSVFMKHGFGALLDQLGILKYLKLPRRPAPADTERLTLGERFRRSLEELGPAFIKLGQLLSVKPGLLPAEVALELEKLRDAVPAIDFAEVRTVIEGEFGMELVRLFPEFSREPLAAASIAQVHSARLPGGERVVVKVQRPGIERIIDQDLRILEDLAGFMDRRTKYGKLYEFGPMVAEFEALLRNELDFRIEAQNAAVFRKNLAHDPTVCVPAIYWSHSSRRVLTMEFIDGLSLSDPAALAGAGLDCRLLARRLAHSLLYQILRDGFFHADPHPGNLMALPGDRIALLDLGMVGRLSEERRDEFVQVLAGLTFGNDRLVVQALIDLDLPRDQPLNLRRLEREVGRIREKYLSLAVNRIKVGEALRELFGLAYQFRLGIPQDFAILGKTLITLEGLVERMDPDLSILEIAEPITRRLLLGNLSPTRLRRRALGELLNVGLLARRLPGFLTNLLIKLEERDYMIQFRLAGGEEWLDRLTRVANRITFSIIVLAVSIIIAGVIIGSGIGGIVAELNQVNALKIETALAVLVIVALIVYLMKTGRL